VMINTKKSALLISSEVLATDLAPWPRKEFSRRVDRRQNENNTNNAPILITGKSPYSIAWMSE